MNTETVKIADLQVGDEILDSEELALSVKNIEQRGASFCVTVNYAEGGFYQAQDSTFTHRGATQVRRIIKPAALYQPQTQNSGLNAIFGKWPGDETDAELSAALESLS